MYLPNPNERHAHYLLVQHGPALECATKVPWKYEANAKPGRREGVDGGLEYLSREGLA